MIRKFPPTRVDPGVTRQVLADSLELMVVSFTFEGGAEGRPHSHPHVQATYVQSGRFAFTVAGEEFEVGPNDSFVIPADAVHGCRALAGGVLIDTFTPRREDFL